jgi:hypothetical protein
MARRRSPMEPGPLPLNTRVKDFVEYVPDRLLKQLTPAAAALTKRDLLLLDAGEFTPATRKLRVQDLHSLRMVFTQTSARRAKKPKNGGHYCCCCCCYFCCCCTAVSVTKPLIPGAAAVGPATLRTERAARLTSPLAPVGIRPMHDRSVFPL